MMLGLLLCGIALVVRSAPDPCASPANSIVRENCLAGVTSDHWDVNGAGCPAIRGFATKSSVVPGETVDLKMKLDAGERVKRVDVYRLGWYGGAGARLVGAFALRWNASEVSAAQPPCSEEASSALYDCGPWAVGASWAVGAGATSGLYVARMVLENGGVCPAACQGRKSGGTGRR